MHRSVIVSKTRYEPISSSSFDRLLCLSRGGDEGNASFCSPSKAAGRSLGGGRKGRDSAGASLGEVKSRSSGAYSASCNNSCSKSDEDSFTSRAGSSVFSSTLLHHRSKCLARHGEVAIVKEWWLLTWSLTIEKSNTVREGSMIGTGMSSERHR